MLPAVGDHYEAELRVLEQRGKALASRNVQLRRILNKRVGTSLSVL
jgi:hypothetical protein